MPSVNINGRKLHYREKGRGFPIIFSHSFLWDSYMWHHQFEALSENYRCIAIDLWDHGLSGALGEPVYSLEQCAEDYWNFTQSLRLERFSYVGLSVGGMIGLRLALSHPEAINSLTIVGSCANTEDDERREVYASLLCQIAGEGIFSPDIIKKILPFFFSQKTFKTKPLLVEFLKEQLASVNQDRIPGLVALGDAILCERKSIESYLSNILIPTQFIVGMDDIARPPRESWQMAKLIAGSRLHLVRDAGRICCLEQPDILTKYLESFIHSTVPVAEELII